MIEAMGQIIAGKWPNMSHFSHAPEHWLYIKDLLTAIEYILASQNIENEYKVVPNRSSSEYDVITYLQKIGDGTRPAVIKEEITASTDSSSIYALGWNQKYALREALEHTLSWYAVNAWALNGSSYECK
jgi:dTDP-D-glucose 4,6-dehydratase